MKSTILLVDDEMYNQKIYSKILKDAGYEVLIAKDSHEAFSTLEKTKPDMLLIDIVLDDESGLDILKEIRSDTDLKDLFVVMITSKLTTRDDQSAGLEQGADGYIVRPIEKRELVARINAFMKHIQTLKALKISEERFKIANSILRHDITNDLTVIQSALYLYETENDETMLDEIKKRVEMSLDTIARQREHETFLNAHVELDEYDIVDVLNKVTVNYPELEVSINSKGKIYADNAVFSVFDNIISNAIKHGKSNKIDVDITADEEYCTISFADNGTGIPDDIKDKIFEKGFHYGPSGHTGIGLYIVKKTLDDYEGEVYVEDNNPKGAVIILKMRKVMS